MENRQDISGEENSSLRTKKEESRYRYDYLSLLNVLAAFSVVAIHVNNCYFIFSPTERYWKTAAVMHFLEYFGVTVFFMISGATLIGFSDRYDLKTYWKKRAGKTVLPYLFWSLFAVLWNLFVTHKLTADAVTARYLANGLLKGNLLSIYWFFIPLFGAYLCIPLFSAVSGDKRKPVFLYLVIAGFTVNLLLPFLNKVTGLNLKMSLSMPAAADYLLLVLTGWLLHTCELKKRTAVLLEAAGLAAVSIIIWRTIADSCAAGELVSNYKGFWEILPFLYGTGVFVFVKGTGGKLMRHAPVKTFINAVQPYTFSVYLIHWYVMEALEKYLPINSFSIIYRVFGPFVIFALSCAAAAGIRRLPGGRRILP